MHRFSHAFHHAGIERADAVVLLSPNCSELHAATLAAEAVGIAAPINPSLSPDHAASLIELAGASVIVAAGPDLDPTVWSLARDLAVRTGVGTVFALHSDDPDVTPGALNPLDSVTVAYLNDRSSELPDDRLPTTPPAADDLAALFHTGGTTRAPKLAAHTHANQVTTAWMIAANGSLAPGDTLFAALPLFHVNAVMVTTLAPLLRNQHVLWAGPLGYRDIALYGIFWKLIEKYRIVALSGVPTVYSVLAQIPVDADISSLKFAVVGASPLPPPPRSVVHSNPTPRSGSARDTGSPRPPAPARAASPTTLAPDRWANACHTSRCVLWIPRPARWSPIPVPRANFRSPDLPCSPGTSAAPMRAAWSIRQRS